MYNAMHFDQLILLVDCLVESHMFARAFNSNHEQRNLLWKAGKSNWKDKDDRRSSSSVEGYRGKAKPNLLTQETQSAACAFRILFRLFNDPKRQEPAEILKRRILKYDQWLRLVRSTFVFARLD